MTLQRAKVLAFERKLDISDGFFYQCHSQDNARKHIPIKLKEKTVRGTISNDMKNKNIEDLVKKDADPKHANIQTVDAAFLDEQCDTLVVKWSIKILPFSGVPHSCAGSDGPEYRKKLIQVIQSYIENNGFAPLAKRYATNIANARWLWRNRLGAERTDIFVTSKMRGKNINLHFEDIRYNLNDLTVSDEQINTLAKYIESGLKGEELVILDIEGRSIVGQGHEVYPSQEFTRDNGRNEANKKNKKSKVLYRTNSDECTGFHSQKLGNAIRTIDTWYEEGARFPIAIEPYGAVTSLSTAFRQKDNSFYSLLDNWVLKDKTPDLDQQHYVIAVLIRGGVFGSSGQE